MSDESPVGLTSVARQSGVLTLLNAIAVASGLVLFTWVAARFGATEATDAFFLALTIPMVLIGPVLASVSAAFLPTLTECRIRRPDRVGAIVGSALLWSVTVALGTAVVTGLLTPTGLATAGRVLSPTVRQLVLHNVIALLPLVVAQTASTVLSVASNTAGRFWLAPCALIVRQLATVAAIAALHGRLGSLALPVGFSIGGVAQLVVLAALWRRAATPIRLDWQVSGELRQSLRLSVPLLAGSVFLHLAIVVTRFLAAGLPAGSVTALDYATRVYSAVIEVVGSGVVVVALTNWSALHARGNTAELGRRVTRTVALTLFALTPVAIVLYAVREPLIAVWLRGAAADPAFRRVTATTLGCLVVALPVEVIGRIYAQLLVARRATVTVGAIAALRTAVVIGLAAGLAKGFGVVGIGLAESLAACVTLGALVVAAHRLPGHSVSAAARSLPRLAAAALGAVTVAYATRHLLAAQPHLAVLGAVTVSTVLAYALFAWLLRVAEVRHVSGYLLARRGPRYTTAQVS